jgi:hypothetical protein
MSRSANRTVLLVLNYKKFSDVIAFLNSVIEHEIEDADIVILDNGSGNDSVQAIRGWIEKNIPQQSEDIISCQNFAIDSNRFSNNIHLKYVRGRIALFSSNVNLGFSGGNNALAHIGRQLGYEFLYLLNSDVLFTDKFSVAKLEALHEREPEAYLSGPCVLNKDGSFDSPFLRDTFWGDALYYGPVNKLRRTLGMPITQFALNALSEPMGSPVYKVSGAAMFFPTKRFFEIGGLDENVWLSSEEAILGEKVFTIGGKVMYLPTTVLVHVKASSPRAQKSKEDILKNHFKQRNYYYRSYRNYGFLQMGILRLGQQIRLLLAKL